MKWDKGIDFEKTKKILLGEIRKAEKKKSNIRKTIRIAHLITALVQLYNGCRASEAVEAFNKWRETGMKEIYVKVRKKKKEDERLIIIPAEVSKYRNLVRFYEEKTNRYKAFICATFDFNTHSLRYAFVTYLSKQGVSPQLIAKITHHSRLDMILSYTQQIKADDLLRKLVK